MYKGTFNHKIFYISNEVQTQNSDNVHTARKISLKNNYGSLRYTNTSLNTCLFTLVFVSFY